MDRLQISSHATSAAMHAAFLVLAFLAPRPAFVDGPHPLLTELRVAEVKIDVVIETGFERDYKPVEGDSGGDGTEPEPGVGEEHGLDPQVKVDAPPSDERELAAKPEAAFVEDVAGMLAGFADQTTGPDSETLNGMLDDGGGAHGPDFGLGGFGMGKAHSCGGVWRREVVNAVGKTETIEQRGCAPLPRSGLAGLARHGSPGIVRLGEVEERVPDIELLVGEPSICGKAPCPWKDIIEKVIKRHRRELQFCFDRALHRQQRELDATVDVSFGIRPEGGTADIELASTSGIAGFDTCVTKRVARWQFPKTGWEIRANYPFRFRTL